MNENINKKKHILQKLIKPKESIHESSHIRKLLLQTP